jgi:indolepyruvate ferredoxin oxidoreductase beta subunit
MISCILAGVGGQGTVLASKLIAQAFMKKGYQVRTAETIGMAQRGGSVVSHVRIGENINSPLIPLHMADIIVGFEPAEAVRCLPYLKEGGTIVVSSRPIKPVTDALSNQAYNANEMLDYLKKTNARTTIINTQSICDSCGSPKIVNVALLGAAIESGALGISLEDMEKTIRANIADKYIALNLKALYAGAEIARNI